ncbi:ABC transporter ATP-binding protein [Chromohalobacter salexigens]|uniref:ABC transporter ATP-binding protein n=1 Tax=Chromohalobacter moromii TaxID=2860329 RepID=A0A9X3B2X1_9GAMM|nr:MULTISPECIES: ABC transporter ATP-binding protein [Chromohalobacter]NWO10939.1 ABC transporter ATP-binding protein [Chromohalobacter salexigens]CDQ33303.1 Spermidine/putrescine import ATP-binding protein PotA [Virgibacillus halodenitrificans]MCK2041733.1 ABC transporter ATP-binding protein [Chromohalobacter moromii]MCK2044667.1 ABC transporter ATP-binding protein [Chromohalobacter moromii]MCT8504179.1 ABC transporter ATP-binding protein [Chromohalobacter moromii]
MSETMTAETADHPGARPAANERGRANHKASSIEMQGLHKRFGRDTVALDGVDLDIRAGEFFTLLGPSGCGKTTLLRILAGLEEPDAGSLVVGGKNITETPPHQRSVNTVFQSYALFPHLSVRENLAFGLKMRGMPAAERHTKVDEIADFIKLGDLVDRHVDQLSGGQRQRIALARALICEPDVLLLDEPLSALDAGLRSQLQVELLRVQKRLGMTFVFVTHDQQEAMVMSDRIAVLNGGTIQQVGAPREVYERPVNAFVARFMGHDNLYTISARKSDRLITALGELTAEDAGNGELLLIRPETLDLLPGAVEGPNHLTATVAERLYRGSHAEFRLAIGNTTLQATVNNRGRHLPEVGETVTVAVAPEDLVTLHE